MGSFHIFRDLRSSREPVKSQRQALPIVLIETKRQKECGLAAIIGVRRIKQVIRDFFAFNYG